MCEFIIGRELAGGETKEDFEKAVELAVRADNGDEGAMTALRKRSKNLPAKSSGILKSHLRGRILSCIAREDQHFTKWTLERDTELLEKNLAGPNPTPMESLLAEQAATCHLQLQVANAHGWGEYINEAQWKRIERCQKLLMTTLKTLAYVRKVPVSMLMVNMAEQQQVNVGAKQD